MPKGVEHCTSWKVKESPSPVQSSPMPKGVEHRLRGDALLRALAGAVISDAERR